MRIKDMDLERIINEEVQEVEFCLELSEYEEQGFRRWPKKTKVKPHFDWSQITLSDEHIIKLINEVSAKMTADKK